MPAAGTEAAICRLRSTGNRLGEWLPVLYPLRSGSALGGWAPVSKDSAGGHASVWEEKGYPTLQGDL